MRKSKFSETQIIAILKAVEAGKTVRDVCRQSPRSGTHQIENFQKEDLSKSNDPEESGFILFQPKQKPHSLPYKLSMKQTSIGDE